MERLINTKEAARLTGYTQCGIRLFVKQGVLKAYRMSPRAQMRFKESDLIKFMKEKTDEKEPPLFDIWKEIRPFWAKVKHRLTAAEKNKLSSMQGVDLEGYLFAIKSLVEKYSADV